MTTYRNPLAWPDGHPRTPRARRGESRFSASIEQAYNHLTDQLRLLGARATVTGNLPTRRSGGEFRPRTPGRGRIDGGKYGVIEDPGIAVYFHTRRLGQVVLACDAWRDAASNLQAIAKSIDAMRGLARWGVSEILERSFAGHAALPPAPGVLDWRSVLKVDPGERDLERIRAQYRAAARSAHPDRGGSHEAMRDVNAAWDAAQREMRNG